MEVLSRSGSTPVTPKTRAIEMLHPIYKKTCRVMYHSPESVEQLTERDWATTLNMLLFGMKPTPVKRWRARHGALKGANRNFVSQCKRQEHYAWCSFFSDTAPGL